MPTGIYERTEEQKKNTKEAQLKFWEKFKAQPDYKEKVREIKRKAIAKHNVETCQCMICKKRRGEDHNPDCNCVVCAGKRRKKGQTLEQIYGSKRAKEIHKTLSESHKGIKPKDTHKTDCNCFICKPKRGKDHALFGKDPRAKKWLEWIVNNTTGYSYFRKGFGAERQRQYIKKIMMALYGLEQKNYSQLDFVCLCEWGFQVGLFNHLEGNYYSIHSVEYLLFNLEHDGLVTLELYNPPYHHPSSQRIVRIETVSITRKGIAFVHSNFIAVDRIKEMKNRLDDNNITKDIGIPISLEERKESLDSIIDDLERPWRENRI